MRQLLPNDKPMKCYYALTDLSKGYTTLFGDCGVRLSGGSPPDQREEVRLSSASTYSACAT